MSTEGRKHPLNAPGRYYIDHDYCTCSAACVDAAPEFYKMDDSGSYVVKQPSTPQEEMRCREGMQVCPVEAIRDDGQS